MVVLKGAIEPRSDARQTGLKLGISCGSAGWFIERHAKLDPVATTTDGIFIAGCCQSPKDIPDTVAQASAAAARVLAMISKGSVEVESATSVIEETLCSGCKTCISLCPYNAISFNEEKKVSVINEALCKGCGTCAAACPSGAITSRHFTAEQIMAQIEGAMV
jgi:heterodisulfide reductase subunit A